MWSFFSRDPTKDFPYDIGEIVPGIEDKSIWSLHEGKKKASGDPVSIFAFDVKGASESQVQVAKGAFKRIKTLRHPNILTFLDGIETEKVIYFATEAVVPLETHLKNNTKDGRVNELEMSWGLHQILKGLSFLVNDVNLIHNNVCMSSVFVDRAGEWKLGGVDYMYPAQGSDSIPPVKILPALEIYDPPEKGDPGRGAKRGTEKWSADMWGLGCLIWEVFNGNLPRTSALKTIGKIPKSLTPHYCELVGANPRSRPNPSKFIENNRNPGGFMNNKFVDTMFFLEEIQIKDQNEKNAFFATLSSDLDSFPPSFCRHKILPQLIVAFEYSNAGSAVLAPLFKLGKLLSAEEYQRKIVPCVVKLFSSSDRQTRVKLLQQIELFVEHLQSDTVNNQIFPNIAQGFMDSNPVVRESTIKAMLHVAEKLNYKNMNEELLKHFARLQSKDDQGGIRTNTTVCLGKIACHINPAMRQKVLISAFLRAIKDPFPPARQAGVLAMASTHNYYTLKESCMRLLPALCSLTMDPEKIVRDQAFNCIRCFLGKLEKASENPEELSNLEKDVLSGSGVNNSASWAGWAVTGMSSLTSKIYKPKGPNKPTTTNTQNASSKESTPRLTPERTTEVPTPAPSSEQEKESQIEQDGAEDGWDDDDWGDMGDMSSKNEDTVASRLEPVETSSEDTGGWDNDDNWGSLEDTNTRTSSVGGSMKLGGKKETSAPPGGWGGWDDDDFASTEDTGLSSTSAYNWGGEDQGGDDFFSNVISESAKKKPSMKSSSSLTSSNRSKSGSPARSNLGNKPSNKTSTHSNQSSAISNTRTMTSKSQTSSGGQLGSKTGRQGSSKVDSGEGWGNEGGWEEDSWSNDNDGWGSLEDTGPSKAELAKQKRDERKLQRQKELADKKASRQSGTGALRLGAKKVASD
ncbi:unnamed protein product [Owenia fusiformis]|uniref:N-terminal kinase-like protein n=1 Tax=Owenia fusiformis TaxID=6347 RepID=A0A8J1UJM5_OWEFU|nr:unnamed protein product [Owenia fusiformis]